MNYIKTAHYILLTTAIFGIECCKEKQKMAATIHKFCINDTLMKSVKLDTAQLKEVINEVKLTGKITFDADKVAKVYPIAGGFVEELKVELGDFVTKGKILAQIKSTEIVDFENQLNSASSNLEVSKKNLQVAEDMYKGKLTVEKDYVSAQNDQRKAQGEYDRIKTILKLYGDGGQNSTYTVKAPISGYVVEKNITENSQFRVDNIENLFTISDLSNLWAVANVYESDISKIKLGQNVLVSTMSYPDIVYKGTIDKIFNVLDANTRVEKIKIKLNNQDNILKPEMFAYVLVTYPEEKKMICIPSKSIIFNNNKNYVVVYKNKCDLKIKEIVIYKSITDYSFIINGLEKGELIVSESQLLIYNASL